MKKTVLALVALACVALVCFALLRPRAKAPESFDEFDAVPSIYPDYVGTTIPYNIAPLNFRIEEEGDAFVTVVEGADGSKIATAGRDVVLPEKKWRALLEKNRDKSIRVDVYSRRDGGWRKFRSFEETISNDPIDGYVAYRLIEPGYDFGHRIALVQRSLESFDEKFFFDNRTTAAAPCVNCHSFQDRKSRRFLFHYRRPDDPTSGGTIVVDGDDALKISGKAENIGVSCSYPAWRPTGDLVAFSANQTRQIFHSLSTQKIEVYDAFSDLALFDAKKNELTVVAATPAEFETFPSWSPDGNELYYSVATIKDDKLRAQLIEYYNYPTLSEEEKKKKREALIEEMSKHIDLLRYDIVKRPFVEATQTLGEPEKVVDVAGEHTALFPRVSPDGKFLAYTVAESGTFPIWRPEADLYLKNLATGEERRWDELDSDDAESYHTWSSSGRWLVFSSRREDGQYTRLYFAHVDENGKGTKPFVMPQRDPSHNRKRFKSYNVPEFTVDPIDFDLYELRAVSQKDSVATKNVDRR